MAQLIGPGPGIKPGSPALQADSLLSESLGKPHEVVCLYFQKSLSTNVLSKTALVFSVFPSVYSTTVTDSLSMTVHILREFKKDDSSSLPNSRIEITPSDGLNSVRKTGQSNSLLPDLHGHKNEGEEMRFGDSSENHVHVMVHGY